MTHSLIKGPSKLFSGTRFSSSKVSPLYTQYLPYFNGELLQFLSAQLTVSVLVHGVKDQSKLLAVTLVNTIQKTPAE